MARCLWSATAAAAAEERSLLSCCFSLPFLLQSRAIPSSERCDASGLQRRQRPLGPFSATGEVRPRRLRWATVEDPKIAALPPPPPNVAIGQSGCWGPRARAHHHFGPGGQGDDTRVCPSSIADSPEHLGQQRLRSRDRVRSQELRVKEWYPTDGGPRLQ